MASAAQKPIRVLEIISGFAIEGPLGGIERFGIELAQALTPQTVEVTVCGMWAYDTPYEAGWVEHLERKGISAFMPTDWDEQSPYRSFTQCLHDTKQHLAGETFDIIHSHCQFGDILALLLKRPLQAQVLLRTVHNEKEWIKRPQRRFWLTHICYPLFFKREMGVAQQVVDNLDQRPLAKLLGKKGTRAYNALNLGRFQQIVCDVAAKKEALSLPGNVHIIGSIGRFEPQKGYHLLLEAVSILLKRETPLSKPLHLLLIGTGTLMPDLQAQATDLGIQDHVHFLGPRNDIEELLSIFDLFVNSSLWEGLPTVIMEAMAAQTAIVATAVGGNAELIKHNKTGFLIPPNDPQQLAQTIHHVLNEVDPSELKAICHQARQFVSENFSMEAVAKQHEVVYLELMDKGTPPDRH